MYNRCTTCVQHAYNTRTTDVQHVYNRCTTCVQQVADWMERNQLKLNKKKSEAIIFLTAKQRVDLHTEISLTIAGHRIMPKSYVRNVGVLFDSGLTVEAQVAQTAKSSYCQIRNTGKFGQA